MNVNQKSIPWGTSPTQRRAALNRPWCSEKYTKVARSSSRSDAPYCLSVVSNEKGQVTYTRTSSRNEAPHDPSVVSNEKGHIRFNHMRLRKNKDLRL